MTHMKSGGFLRRPLWVLGLAGVVVVAVLDGGQRAGGVQGEGDTGAVAALVREIAVQQEQIVANQAQIEERLGRVAEDVRLARLFSARVGGGRSAP